MSVEETKMVEVERKGAFISIPFAELKVGDTFSLDEGVWFVDTQLERFSDVRERVAFRCHGKWYLKLNRGNLVRPLLGNLPFGKIDTDRTELILGNHYVGRVALSRVL